jgi:uncharacterized protein YjlB
MLLEHTKRVLENLTGFGRPERRDLRSLVKQRKPVTFRFRDDGETPNNPNLPLVIYRNAVVLDGSFDPAAVFEEIFAANHWRDSWRDGIYDFLHFHSMTHEVLGIARGAAKVQFGGAKGRVVNVKAGDVAVLPAGTGHCRISAGKDLLVVGAYPQSGRYDQPRPEEADHEKARAAIGKVKPPRADPLYGKDGPLLALWKAGAAGQN